MLIVGGKWTTYREMAEDGVDKILNSPIGANLREKAQECHTLHIDLLGKRGYSENLIGVLLQEYGHIISPSTASHLVRAYGGNAVNVLLTNNHNNKSGTSNKQLDSSSSLSSAAAAAHKLLVPGYPYIEAEVLYAIRYEYACRIEDIIARRTRLAFLNREAALLAIPKVAQLMATELNWSKAKTNKEIDDCIKFMQTFGGPKPLKYTNIHSEGSLCVYIYLFYDICLFISFFICIDVFANVLLHFYFFKNIL